jgi:LacI family transcriptional regulator
VADRGVGALLEVQARGLELPDDISRMGIDNLGIPVHLSTALTTIHLPTSQLGVKAGELLVAMMRGETIPQKMELPIDLVICHSSKAPVPKY